jgi:hypothetical protein
LSRFDRSSFDDTSDIWQLKIPGSQSAIAEISLKIRRTWNSSSNLACLTRTFELKLPFKNSATRYKFSRKNNVPSKSNTSTFLSLTKTKVIRIENLLNYTVVCTGPTLS